MRYGTSIRCIVSIELMIGDIERLLGLTLVTLGIVLMIVGIFIYFLPQMFVRELKLTENPLIILPLKKNGFWIGFSPILFLILLVLYLLLWYRYL